MDYNLISENVLSAEFPSGETVQALTYQTYNLGRLIDSNGTPEVCQLYVSTWNIWRYLIK